MFPLIKLILSTATRGTIYEGVLVRVVVWVDLLVCVGMLVSMCGHICWETVGVVV